MRTIESTNNDIVKHIVSLQSSKGGKEHGQFIVEGLRTCQSFIDNGYEPVMIFLAKHLASQNPFLDHPSCILVSERVMEKISTVTTPSGILMIFSTPQKVAISTLSSGLILARISDPGNMGTLIRSAAAFGYSTVIVVEGCDPFCSKVIQASAGTLPLISLIQCNWSDIIHHKKNITLAALVVSNGQSITALETKPTLFVVGNEAHGIPQEWILQCDILVTLPITQTVESLNAAVAGSLALALFKK